MIEILPFSLIGKIPSSPVYVSLFGGGIIAQPRAAA
jgi:hypothetical protein